MAEPIAWDAGDLGGAGLVRDALPAADALDARLAALAAAGAPLRRALARIAARLVAKRAWEALGFVRLADYAREGPGLSARELRDLAHVDGALERLPRIEAAFVGGHLSWTKARLLCRVANAEDEALWLAGAGAMTASALAREVRVVDCTSLEAIGIDPGARPGSGSDPAGETDEEGAPDERRVTLHVPCAPRVLAKWGPLRRLAERVCGERLPADACAEWIAAEMLSALPVASADEVPEPLARRCRGGTSSRDAAGAPACSLASGGVVVAAAPASVSGDAFGSSETQTPGPAPAAASASSDHAPILAELVAGLDEADAFELDSRLRRAAALVHGLTARIGPLLLRLAARRGFCEAGFRGVDDYARERLGMSPRRARSILRLERACAASPTLARAWRAGQLGFSKAQTLVPLVLADGSGPCHAAWIARADRITVRRLEDDVDYAIENGVLDPADLPALPVFGLAAPAVRAAGLEPPGAGCIGIDPGRIERVVTRLLRAELPAGLQIGARSTLWDGSNPAWRDRSVWRINLLADVARLFLACLATVQRRIERETGRCATRGDALEALFDHAQATWRLRERPLSRDERVMERDGWRCTVPGCTSYRNLHLHHVTYRSAGGCDLAWNLTTLCAAHHHHAIHEGSGRSRVRISGLAPRGLRFEMPLGTWAAGDVRADAGSAGPLPHRA